MPSATGSHSGPAAQRPNSTTGTAPFATSMRPTGIAYFQPSTRYTLVAPRFLEPCLRRSIPGRASRRDSWWASPPAGRRRGSTGRASPVGRLALAPELDRDGRASELPGHTKPVQQVTRVRLRDRVGPVRDDREARRRRADLRSVEQPHSLAHGLGRLLPLDQRLEHPVHLGRGHALLPLLGDGEDELEQARDALAR